MLVNVGHQAGSYGQLTLSASDAVTPTFSIGRESDATGTVTLASGTITASSVYSGYNGNGVFSNLAGTVQADTLGVSYNSSSAQGYMYCGPGSTTDVSFVLQVGRYGNGTVDCYGSMKIPHASQGLYIGNIGESEGTFNLYPGAYLNVCNRIVLGYTTGSGTFNQYGGDAVVGVYFYIGGINGNTTATSYCNLYGGTLTVSNMVYVGRNSGNTGELTVSGGHAIFWEKQFGLTVGTYAGSTGTVYLVDGILAVGLMRDVSGYSQFFFDGGILEALSSSTKFMTGLNKCEVRAGGAKIDTSGDDITIAQSIAHDSRGLEPTKDGGLTKLGAGTLTMTGTLGFTGDLGANGGSLDLSATSYALPSGSGLWGNGTLVPPSGGFSIPADSWVTPGDTNGVGTLTVTGNLTLNGEIRARISPDGTECGTLAVGGTLLFPEGSELVIENPEDMLKNENYTFVTASSLSGQPTVSNLPQLWSLKVSPTQIRAVYISGTMISVR